MRGTVVLHIQREGEATIREVALAGDLVRVGRGSLCEIALPDDRLAEVHVIMRRRHATWTVQTLGAGRSVVLNGEPLEGLARLSAGSCIVLGDHRLKLVEIERDAAVKPPGSFERPILMHGTQVAEREPITSVRDVKSSRALGVGTGAASPHGVEPWKPVPYGSAKQRVAGAAGLSHERRVGGTAGAERPEPSGGWRSIPLTDPLASRSRVERETVSRIEPSIRDRLDTRGIPGAPSVHRKHVDHRLRPLEPTLRSTTVERLSPPTRIAWPQGPRIIDPPRPRESIDHAPSPDARDVSRTCHIDESLSVENKSDLETGPLPDTDWLDPEELAGRRAWDHSQDTLEPADSLREFELPGDFAQLATASEAELYVESGEPPPELPFDETHAALRVEATQAAAADVTTDVPSRSRAPEAEPDPAEPSRSTDDALAARERLPSVVAIVAACGLSNRAAQGPQRRIHQVRSASTRIPVPTDPQAPCVWQFPLWLAVPFALGSTVLLGALAAYLSACWAMDGRAAGALARAWTSGRAVVELPRRERLPNATWWASRPDSLYLHAAALSAPGGDPLDQEDASTFLDLAEMTSPWHAGVRFARRKQARAGASAGLDLASADMAACTLAAEQALGSGRLDECRERIQHALALARSLESRRAHFPALDRDSTGMRFLLPNEDVITPLVRLARAAEAKSVGPTLPDHPGILVAAYRQARREARADADALLRRILALPVESATGPDLWWNLAAKAEALALAERWSESVDAYRAAAEACRDPLLACVLWHNLSDVLSRIRSTENARVATRNARARARELGGDQGLEARRALDALEGRGDHDG